MTIMAQRAPAVPSIETLEKRYPLTDRAAASIAERRTRVNSAIRRESRSFMGLLGGCALVPAEEQTIKREGTQLDNLYMTHPGLVTLHRLCFWKPRSNPNAWHGAETEPATVEPTFRIVADRAEATANAAAEIGYKYHIRRYAPRLTLGWVGGRNVENDELVEDIATEAPYLPVAVKNGLDGNIDVALDQVARINSLRSPDQAAAILIYRGGENAKDPHSWERQYREALDITDGLMVVDLAHGTEMAHHPQGLFEKSVEGQLAGLAAVIRIAERLGQMPLGAMMEATDARCNPVDPATRFRPASDGLIHLNQLHNELTGAATFVA